MVGLATDYCVKNTALDALRDGLRGRRLTRAAVRGVDVTSGDSERALDEMRDGRREGGRVSRDVAAWERMLESMRVFFRSVPPPSAGGRVVELDGVIAAVTPAVPERSLPNSVVYETEDHLIAALDELSELYDDAGVAGLDGLDAGVPRAGAGRARRGRQRARRQSRGDDRRPRRDRAAAGRGSGAGPASRGPRTSA